jgi:allantoinase
MGLEHQPPDRAVLRPSVASTGAVAKALGPSHVEESKARAVGAGGSPTIPTMAVERLILRSRRVVTPDGQVAADVVVEGVHIADVEAISTRRPASANVEELGDLVLMPGLVDAHVHVNEPGRTEWEGFAHATRAGAAGGVTTLADMPLNSDPVTISVAALAAKQAAAEGRCWIDVGFHAGLVPANSGRRDQILDLDARGVLAWKAFLCDSGLADFPAATRADLEAAMPVLAEAGARLLVHAELARAAPPTSFDRYRDWEASRPPEWEVEAIALLIALCRATGCAVHVVHLAAADALPLLRQARAEGLPVTVETCPHYLHFAAEDIPDGDARYKCAPPIRGRANREALWGALADRTIDLVASDHSPAPPALKAAPDGDLARAWGGIASIQLTLPVVWTGARARGLALERLAEWLCARPAELLRLDRDRGAIAAGKLASLVAWDPEASFVVDPARLLFRHPSTTPYAGERLQGVVERAWVRGREVARGGEILGAPTGRLVARAADAGADRCAALLRLSPDARRDLLARCCSARAWIDAMLDALATAGAGSRLSTLVEQAFDQLRREDWLEAFAGHPRIGDLDRLRHRFASTAALATAEQAGARAASDKVLRALAQGNADYERRFGHIFIVCASGKSADEMLAILDQRLGNHPDVELRIAAGEQRKITRLRLASMA